MCVFTLLLLLDFFESFRNVQSKFVGFFQGIYGKNYGCMSILMVWFDATVPFHNGSRDICSGVRTFCLCIILYAKYFLQAKEKMLYLCCLKNNKNKKNEKGVWMKGLFQIEKMVITVFNGEITDQYVESLHVGSKLVYHLRQTMIWVN